MTAARDERPSATSESGGVALASARGRWIVAASVLGSGAVFLESTVSNVALPAIGRDLDLGLSGLQWVMNLYLLALSSLILFGGALGDRFSRARVFALGATGFAVACLVAGFATSAPVLFAARVAQGATGALLVPNSLAMLETSIRQVDRSAAIGHWAAWSTVSTAIGPFVGGWIVTATSWHVVFACVVPFALVAAWISIHHLGSTNGPSSSSAGRLSPVTIDYAGAVLVSTSLASLTWAIVQEPEYGVRDVRIVLAALLGVASLVAFVVVERRVAQPLLPIGIFRSRQFTGANATTLFVYAALGGLFFLLMLQLQYGLGYTAFAAGSALLPLNILMATLSSLAGRLAQRWGPRWPMTLGALVAAIGLMLMRRVAPGASYASTVLPALIVFGIGLATLVAPLTAAVLAAVDDQFVGVASAVNNSVARVAGLLATALLPVVVGMGGTGRVGRTALAAGFPSAMTISAALCVVGAAVAWLTVGDQLTTAKRS